MKKETADREWIEIKLSFRLRIHKSTGELIKVYIGEILGFLGEMIEKAFLKSGFHGLISEFLVEYPDGTGDRYTPDWLDDEK